jgi:hypothetical protein
MAALVPGIVQINGTIIINTSIVAVPPPTLTAVFVPANGGSVINLGEVPFVTLTASGGFVYAIPASFNNGTNAYGPGRYEFRICGTGAPNTGITVQGTNVNFKQTQFPPTASPVTLHTTTAAALAAAATATGTGLGGSACCGLAASGQSTIDPFASNGQRCSAGAGVGACPYSSSQSQFPSYSSFPGFSGGCSSGGCGFGSAGSFPYFQ